MISRRIPAALRQGPCLPPLKPGRASHRFLQSKATSNKLSDGDLKSVRPMFDLSGKNYVVTGGGRGIGYASARAIAEYGGNVAVLDVLPKPVDDFETLAEEFGAKTSYIHADVTNEESLTKGFEKVVSELGSIDGIIPAAGIALDKAFTEHTWAEMSRLLNINVAGTFFSVQLAVQQMLKQGTGGSVVLIASVASHVAVPGQRLSAYHATKGAVRILGKTLSVELAPKGIRINSISPGYIATDMTLAIKDQYPHMIQMMNEAPPMERIGNRNDLVGAMIYLLSDASAYTTGTDIQVTGGIHAGRIKDPLCNFD